MNAGTIIRLAADWHRWHQATQRLSWSEIEDLRNKAVELALESLVRDDDPRLARLQELVQLAAKAAHPHPRGHRRTGAALEQRTKALRP